MSEEKIQPGDGPYVLDNILFNDDARMAVWIQERLGISLPAVMFRAFGMILDDRVVAGAYFYDYYDHNDIKDISLAAAIDVPVMTCRAGLKRVFEYPFVQLGLPRVSAQIELENRRAVEQAEILGFVLEGKKLRMGRNRSDVGIFGLYPENCPFMKE